MSHSGSIFAWLIGLISSLGAVAAVILLIVKVMTSGDSEADDDDSNVGR